MNPLTLDYCREGGPFHVRPNMSIEWDWAVRAANGDTIAVTDDADVAGYLAELLNFGMKFGSRTPPPDVDGGPTNKTKGKTT